MERQEIRSTYLVGALPHLISMLEKDDHYTFSESAVDIQVTYYTVSSARAELARDVLEMITKHLPRKLTTVTPKDLTEVYGSELYTVTLETYIW